MVRAGSSLLCLAAVALAVPAAAAAAPETGITAGPIGRTGDSSPNFAFESSDPGATFECSLDGAAFSACGSPIAYAGVTESPHVFAVRAVDASGTVDPTPAERRFVTDAHVDAAVSAARRQHAGGNVVIAARVDALEPLTVRADGEITLGSEHYRLGPVRERVRSGRTVVRLKPLDPDDAKRILRLLDHGASARVRLDVRLADVIANQLRVPLTVTVTAAAPIAPA
jgi:hypothetical protein